MKKQDCISMKQALHRLFPLTVDNQYQGAKIAQWGLILMVAISIGRSLAHIFLPDGGAQSIATIPLNTFSASAEAVIIGMFAQWGLSQLMVGLMMAVVLWRYRSLIPLMWLFILLEWSGRLLIGLAKPFETVNTAPGAVGNRVIPLLAVLMLVLSLREKKTAA
ncbi:MAG: hypothetical protein V2J07_06080 [Anaerolineae bacterium]|jgi:hypothetical protein|nr:hypothetical protein [Anaerolineae bacterium]